MHSFQHEVEMCFSSSFIRKDTESTRVQHIVGSFEKQISCHMCYMEDIEKLPFLSFMYEDMLCELLFVTKTLFLPVGNFTSCALQGFFFWERCQMFNNNKCKSNSTQTLLWCIIQQWKGAKTATASRTAWPPGTRVRPCVQYARNLNINDLDPVWWNVAHRSWCQSQMFLDGVLGGWRGAGCGAHCCCVTHNHWIHAHSETSCLQCYIIPAAITIIQVYQFYNYF